MDNLNFSELQVKLEKLKAKQKESFERLSIQMNLANIEQSNDILSIYNDIKNMHLMFESGEIDEKQVENIKTKYGTETNK